MTDHPSRTLASFAAGLQAGAIPADVLRRTEDLLLDWAASALAGKGAEPVEIIERFARAMGPQMDRNPGGAEVLISRRHTSPLFAAMVNAAASHVVEQDDVHNGSVFHPATVVFPPALAVAQALGKSGRDLLVACVAGYEVGIRVGEYLGRSHYRVFHTTGTAGTLAAAAAVGRLLELTPEQMLHAFGSAGTQSAGLWEFLRDAAHSKQLHAAHAAAAGLTSAYLARDGFTGAQHILEGPQGLAAGTSTDADPARLVEGLGTRWTVAETSFKFHASCRHNHPAADALLKAMQDHRIASADIAGVTAHVHQAAIDVLGPVTDPQTVHQAKFSMGTVLGLIATQGRAGLAEFDACLNDAAVRDFAGRVRMELDAEVDGAYPARWIGKVTLTTCDGRTLMARVDEPKGDPGNTLSRAELEDKALRLGIYRSAASNAEMYRIIDTVWGMEHLAVIADLLPATQTVREVMKTLNSLLFVPASRPDRIAKALAAGADAVIVDLEDAVAPADKDSARAALAAALDPSRPVMVRVNAADTTWFPADLELLAHPGIAAVVLPKAEHAEDVAVVHHAAGGKPVLPLIESALGFEQRLALAHAEGVQRLIFGQIDFQADMGMRATEEELLPFRVALVLASRLADIAPPIDGPTTAIDDETVLRSDALRARRLGFGGKLCIHPRQVAVVNQCFTPDGDEIAWARRVIAADAAAGGAAVAVDGKMVDRPVVLRAQAILAEAALRSS